MKNSLLAASIVSITLFSPSIFATATLDEWGTSASVASGACVGNSCSPLGVVVGGITQEVSTVGVNQLSVNTGSVGIAAGTAQASAEVTGGLDTPVLKAKASAVADSWIGAGAFAIQGYQFTGSVADTIDLSIAFDGVLTNPDNDKATGFAVGMYLFSASDIDFASITGDAAQVLGGLALLADGLAANQQYELEVHASGNVNELGSLSLLLNPGEQFYLAGGVLAAAGGNGAIADAFSTLTTTFEAGAADVLVSASSVSVPSPSTFYLLFPLSLMLLASSVKNKT